MACLGACEILIGKIKLPALCEQSVENGPSVTLSLVLVLLCRGRELKTVLPVLQPQQNSLCQALPRKIKKSIKVLWHKYPYLGKIYSVASSSGQFSCVLVPRAPIAAWGEGVEEFLQQPGPGRTFLSSGRGLGLLSAGSLKGWEGRNKHGSFPP